LIDAFRKDLDQATILAQDKQAGHVALDLLEAKVLDALAKAEGQ
jgi:hypothetical protein